MSKLPVTEKPNATTVINQKTKGSLLTQKATEPLSRLSSQGENVSVPNKDGQVVQTTEGVFRPIKRVLDGLNFSYSLLNLGYLNTFRRSKHTLEHHVGGAHLAGKFSPSQVHFWTVQICQTSRKFSCLKYFGPFASNFPAVILLLLTLTLFIDPALNWYFAPPLLWHGRERAGTLRRHPEIFSPSGSILNSPNFSHTSLNLDCLKYFWTDG